MSINRDDLEWSSEKFKAGTEPPKKGRGCFFYGCITAIVLAALMMIVIAVSGYFGYQAYIKLVDQYTSPTRMNLPKMEMSEQDRKALRERSEAFKKALDKGEDIEPLVLTGDELNVLLAGETGVADRVYFIIDGDKLKGQVSLPLDAVGLPGLKGRYFNGKAAFLASLRDGQLVVTVDSAEVNGEPLSEQFLTGLRNANLAEDATKDPDNARLLNKLESLQIKDGKVTIKAKPKEGRSPAATKKEQPSEEMKVKEPEEKVAPPPAEKGEKPDDQEKSSVLL